MKSVLNIYWKDCCWSWSSNTLTTWCKELTHWKRPWCWERLKAGGEGDDRGWDGWMASVIPWMLVCPSSGSWWWTGKPGVLQSMGSQRIRHDWATELSLPKYLLASQFNISCVLNYHKINLSAACLYSFSIPMRIQLSFVSNRTFQRQEIKMQ